MAFPLVAKAKNGQNARVMWTTPQDPPPVAPPTLDLLQQLQLVGWVDRTALAVLLVFFVLGLFKGLIWQVSRIAILVVAYVVAGRFGGELGMLLARTPAVGGQNGPGPVEPADTTIYLAYVLLFVVVLIVLSLVAMLLQRLAAKVGLGFFDRLGGGVLGVATGACVVLFGLFVVNMFFRSSQLAMAAESSHSLRLSKRAIDWLGERVPDDLRTVFALVPLQTPPPANGAVPNPDAPGQPAPPPGEPPPGSERPKRSGR